MQRYVKRSGPDSRLTPRTAASPFYSSPWQADAGLHNVIMRILSPDGGGGIRGGNSLTEEHHWYGSPTRATFGSCQFRVISCQHGS